MIVKKNSYFVVLELRNIATACAKVNYIFKQKEDAEYSFPDIDLHDSTSNLNDSLLFDNSNNLKAWRYATADEIALYDLHKKPCSVSGIPEKKQDYSYLTKLLKKYGIR